MKKLRRCTGHVYDMSHGRGIEAAERAAICGAELLVKKLTELRLEGERRRQFTIKNQGEYVAWANNPFNSTPVRY